MNFFNDIGKGIAKATSGLQIESLKDQRNKLQADFEIVKSLRIQYNLYAAEREELKLLRERYAAEQSTFHIKSNIMTESDATKQELKHMYMNISVSFGRMVAAVNSSLKTIDDMAGEMNDALFEIKSREFENAEKDINSRLDKARDVYHG